MESKDESAKSSRRGALKLMGGIGLFIACGDAQDTTDSGAPLSPTGELPAPSLATCDATFAQDEGPFFVSERPLRADLTADTTNVNATNGVPMRLRFTVYRVANDDCTPAEGVEVDVWHADTGGLYSDLCVQGTEGDKSLRGYQITDAHGVVEFTTIFPGWYPGRTIHIHVKLRRYEGAVAVVDFTTQLYIDDAIADRVVSNGAYNTRGARGVINSNDGLFTAVNNSGGMPIRLPENICELVAAGEAPFGPNGRPPGDGPPPMVTADSMGPRLLLDTTEASDGSGYLSSFSFGLVEA